jgi:hypothetical protein
MGRQTRRLRANRVKGQCHPRLVANANLDPAADPSANANANAEEGCIPEKILEDVSRRIGLGGRGGSRSRRKPLLKRVAAHFGVDPKNQYSLLQALPIDEETKKRLQKENLRPPQPASWKDNPDEWLDSNNIRDVMRQYEEARPDFKFLGPYPIDFAARDPYSKGKVKCLISEMCDLDIDGKDMAGKDYIGIIFNLDPHNKGGSHWVASFIDIPKKEFIYFDSYGMKPPKQIYRFMQWLTIQEPKMKLRMNGVEMQKKDSECGMYSMYFIICMLEGESFKDFYERAPSDDFMEKVMRERLFST